jgi:hypothetical protein
MPGLGKVQRDARIGVRTRSAGRMRDRELRTLQMRFIRRRIRIIREQVQANRGLIERGEP